MLAKVEKYILNPRIAKKYIYLKKKAFIRKSVCVKCGSHEPDLTEETYKNNSNCSNWNESHRVDWKHYKIRKRNHKN